MIIIVNTTLFNFDLVGTNLLNLIVKELHLNSVFVFFLHTVEQTLVSIAVMGQ